MGISNFTRRERMTDKNFPQETKKFEIEAYEKPRNLKELKKTHVPFTGSPLKHPYDPKKVVLVPDPFGSNPIYYEFKSKDISFLEELPSLVDLNGKTIKMVRLWLKKMSVGVLCSPFLIEEIKK
jgi:inorganic pyrophosphatase